MRYRIIGLIALTLAAGSVGLAQTLPAPPSADAKTVAQDGNAFACDLYARLQKEEGDIFFSPYSISTALAMTYAGAKGKTAEEMATVLHFDLPPDKLHAGFAELVKRFNAQGEKRPYQLSVANRLWGQKGFTFLPAFLNLTTDKYGAGLEELDFVKQTEESRKIINAWVEKQTNDKIKDLLQKGDIETTTRLVLTNAIYFKAAWASKFLADSTKPGDFTLANGTKVKVPLMAKFEHLGYFDGGTFQALNIPYKDYALSMVVLLPRQADGLPALEKQLTAANLKQWSNKMTTHNVNLKLPKFKTTSRFNLGQTLSDMGMPTAFNPDKADFSGMTTQDQLYISKVIHKAFVDVHEIGTEAAAATAVIMNAPIGLPPKLPQATFHADRPFLYLIQENQTGAILFMGRLTNPQ
jgi:serpin B